MPDLSFHRLLPVRKKLTLHATFGASEAIRKYAEDATNAGAQVQNALTNALKGTEDAFVSLLTKGDLSINGLKNAFGSLANSIIADITRMIVKQSIMAPLMQMMGLSGGGAAGGGGGFSIGGLINTCVTSWSDGEGRC